MCLPEEFLKLRRVNEQDCEILWNWVNDPAVRSSSFFSDLISWEEHVKWFINKLDLINCYYFIALNNHDKPIGQIRFDVNSQLQAEVDISIDIQERGKGYASHLIKLSVEHLFAHTLVKSINAFIKSDNQASIKSFQKAGFRYIGIEKIREKYFALHYIAVKNNE
ncbi:MULTISPECIES: GNAT family N-acetyltransferase [Pseudanabaena]|uniref:GCN5-related N-acetyltransferase n=2 Tax=Pseudanabaena TaxID=1152 RepID=L8N6J2_9CYAN|nr:MULTISPECIES: GNAT family N-acetyltransferase [Pseudanabaena]ELS34320.1 GCN5-related N-acetyltransferase [Pseudanabaena biceps PCC 7429]MDG3493462.1 GNAT family N-acetyltransferase [Pseudanabaena catenata USMAC16]